MAGWPTDPVIYEISTWLWLDGLGGVGEAPLGLGDVPAAEWDRLAAMPIDAVWLMGVWERSPIGTEVMRSNQDLCRFAGNVLPDFTPDLIVGSPYCIRRYVPDERFGGWSGLRLARDQLSARGLCLILDFVPNHVAPDHDWVTTRPDFLIRGDEGDLERQPGDFTRAGAGIVAFGRDPYSAPWTDVVQLNTFSPDLRAATIELLSTIGDYCDGVRCDMAMLAINEIFARTWGDRAGPIPSDEYWSLVVDGVRARHPDFLFLAEAYWDNEWRLLQQGFDYCYDKVLYDRVTAGDAEGVRLHLGADLSYQRHLVRFIENHDEDRAAAVMAPGLARAAAVAIATLPGATLHYDGQFDGERIRLPVALGRKPPEPVDAGLADFHRVLLGAARETRRGEWRLCHVTGWPDNDSGRNIVAWSWLTDDATFVVAVNFSGAPAQGQLWIPLRTLPEGPCVVADLLAGQTYLRDPVELRDQGMYVGLGEHGVHLLRFPF